MKASQDQALGQLLAAWKRREDARSARDFSQLADAHFELDGARDRMRTSMLDPR